MPTTAHIHPDRVRKIFDHHKITERGAVPKNTDVKIVRMVMSAATLVADYILRTIAETVDGAEDPVELFILRALLAPMILDSDNLDATKLTDPLDDETAQKIIQKVGIDTRFRNGLYSALVTARDDISNLTAYLLLYRDLKHVSDEEGTIKVAIPYFPTSVRVSLIYLNLLTNGSFQTAFFVQVLCNVYFRF